MFSFEPKATNTTALTRQCSEISIAMPPLPLIDYLNNLKYNKHPRAIMEPGNDHPVYHYRQCEIGWSEITERLRKIQSNVVTLHHDIEGIMTSVLDKKKKEELETTTYVDNQTPEDYDSELQQHDLHILYVTERSQEDLLLVVHEIAKMLGFRLKLCEIINVYRVGHRGRKDGRPRVISVRFLLRNIRNALLKAFDDYGSKTIEIIIAGKKNSIALVERPIWTKTEKT